MAACGALRAWPDLNGRRVGWSISNPGVGVCSDLSVARPNKTLQTQNNEAHNHNIMGQIKISALIGCRRC